VFFYGFDDLTPLERDAVETLARVVGIEVMVSLTFDAGRSAMAAGAELVAELTPLAERVIELPAREDFYAPAAREALHHVERHLFEDSVFERIDPGPSISLLEAAGALAETELVAGEVLSLISEGVPPEEIAVVYRSLDHAAPVIDRTFRSYGIPCVVERRPRFAHTALGRGLLGLARCALLGGERAGASDLLDYLHTPGVLRRIELADRADLEVRCAGAAHADGLRARLGFELGEIDALAAAADPVAELVRQGRRLLSAPCRSAAQVLDPHQELDASALARLLELSAELEELGETPPGEELIQLLEDLELHPRAVREGGVLLSDPLAIRARRFQVVFVCGLEERVFPRVGTAEPFLADELRRELALASDVRLRPAEDALARERYLFYSCLSRATDRVILSYQSADEEGNLKLPSPFLANVELLLDVEWAARRRRRSLSDVVWPVDEAPSSRERAKSLAALGAPAGGEPLAPERRLHEPALKAVRHTRLLSAGALESYAECPVKWLVERELEPRQLEPEAEPLARGSYAHDLLEQILRGLSGPVTPESLPEAIRLLDQHLEELSPRLAPGRTPELRRAVAEAIAGDLRRYLEHEASCGCGWEPRALELRFGFDEEERSLPALTLGAEGMAVSIRGAIDRVDVEPGGRRAVVRDYKSGAARPGHRGSNWRAEQRLQVALYMIAVRDLMGLEPVAGLYQPLGGKDLRARGVYLDGAPVGAQLVATDARTPEELTADLEDAAERAVTLATRLREGRLDPSPATCSRDGCRYPGICRGQ
jgi:RecB family exonuclease